MFGADEPPLTREGLEGRVFPVGRGVEALRRAALGERERDALLSLVDPLSSEEVRVEALGVVAGWTGDRARGAFAILVSWANEPLHVGPCVHDALVALAPGNVDLALDALGPELVAAIRGEPFIVRCVSCAKDNRLPRMPPRGKRATCGDCKNPLEVWGNANR